MKLLFLIFFISTLGCVQKPDEISNICLEGHLYIKYKNMLATKFDDGGKPIKCPENQKKDLVSESTTKELTEHAMDWLKFVDKKDLKGSWDNAAPFFKSAISQKDWVKKGSEVSNQIGKLIKREYQNSNIDGMRATIIFRSDFENFPQATETISMILVDGKWMVVGYFVQ